MSSGFLKFNKSDSDMSDSVIRSYVITRTGKTEPLSIDKITKRLIDIIERKPVIKYIICSIFIFIIKRHGYRCLCSNVWFFIKS